MTRLEQLLNYPFGRIEQAWTSRDTILYALACGAGADDLALVWEKQLHALPSMASVLASPANWYADPASGLDHRQVVHASERIELDGPLPVSGSFVATPMIEAVVDRGEMRGALVVTGREIRDSATGARLARVTHRALCRAEGGIGSWGDAPAPAPPLPDHAPKRVLDVPVSPRAAALYRLCGDVNPLHIEPQFARNAGFRAPILHGLCSYGHVVRVICAANPGAVLRIVDCRFTAPVFPGDRLSVEMWDSADGCRFRASVAGRVVIDNGEMIFS